MQYKYIQIHFNHSEQVGPKQVIQIHNHLNDDRKAFPKTPRDVTTDINENLLSQHGAHIITREKEPIKAALYSTTKRI